MSALFIYSDEHTAVIAQDTLGYRQVDKEPLRPCSYHSKTMYFPEFRSIVAYIGYKNLSLDIFDFTHNRVIANDVDSYVEMLRDHFYGHLNLERYSENVTAHRCDTSVLGDVVIIGYSFRDHKLKRFFLSVDRDKCVLEEKEMKTSSVILHPNIENSLIRQSILSDKSLTIQEIAASCLKQVYFESMNPETFKVGIGGDIIVATISTLDGFKVQISTPHRFENFNEQYQKAIDNNS